MKPEKPDVLIAELARWSPHKLPRRNKTAIFVTLRSVDDRKPEAVFTTRATNGNEEHVLRLPIGALLHFLERLDGLREDLEQLDEELLDARPGTDDVKKAVREFQEIMADDADSADSEDSDDSDDEERMLRKLNK